MKKFLIILLIIALLCAGGYYYRDILAKLVTPPGAPPPPPVKEEPKPEPPAPPAPKEEPKPAPQPPAQVAEQPKQPQERPRSAEHATVLQVASNATESEKLQELVETGKISQEAAQTLQTWVKENPNFKIEETGIAETGATGEKQTRYRLVSENGGDDVVINVATPRQGKPTISKVTVVPSDKMQVNKQSDALSVVEGFMEALKRGDMDTARRLTSGTDISDATLAGLCIMFEEGDLTMRKNSPIRNMFKNEENAGYVVYMSSGESGKQAGSVGLELVYDAENGWRVKAVAMDSLLDGYEQRGAAEGGVYFPLVKNPQGGDSLVLYFGFNDATLSPRSLSQLKIVAGLLKGSKGDLNISGHTDDVGTAEYNMNLSERRALAVKEALIAHGVEAHHITTKGLGKSQPRRVYRADDNPETIRTIRSGNRRAEIYLDF